MDSIRHRKVNVLIGVLPRINTKKWSELTNYWILVLRDFVSISAGTHDWYVEPTAYVLIEIAPVWVSWTSQAQPLPWMPARAALNFSFMASKLP